MTRYDTRFDQRLHLNSTSLPWYVGCHGSSVIHPISIRCALALVEEVEDFPLLFGLHISKADVIPERSIGDRDGNAKRFHGVAAVFETR